MARPRADNGMYTSAASMLNAAASTGSRSIPRIRTFTSMVLQTLKSRQAGRRAVI